MKNFIKSLVLIILILSFTNVNAAPQIDYNLALPDLIDSSDNGASNSDNITSADPRTYEVECTEAGKFIKIRESDPKGNGHTYTTSWQECTEAGYMNITTDIGAVHSLYEVNYIISDDDSGTNLVRSGDIDVAIGDDSDFPTVLDIPDLIEADDSGFSNTDNITNIEDTRFQATCKEDTVRVYMRIGVEGHSNGIYKDCHGAGDILTFSDLNISDYTGEYYVYMKAINSNNVSSVRSGILNMVEDHRGPVLTEVTSITSPSITNRPSYVLNYDDDFSMGNLEISGSCSSYFTNIGYNLKNGNVIITASSNMPNGIYDDCTLISTDKAGNVSNILNIPSFEIKKKKRSHGRSGPIEKIDICNYTKGDKSGDYHDGKCTKDGQKAEGIDICESGDTSGNFYDKKCDKKGTKSGILKKDTKDENNEQSEKHNKKVEKVIIEEIEEFSSEKNKYKKLLEEKYSWLLMKFKGKNLENILKNTDKLILEARISDLTDEKKLSKIALLTAFRELLLK